jgi:hypothetical protein
MSKPIQFNAILSGVSTRADGSLTLRISTPEFSAEETTVLLHLCRINLDCTLTPLNQELEAPLEVKAEIESRTPSQRLRGVLFVWWKAELSQGKIPKDTTFEVFYAQKVEHLIEWVKGKLPPE